MRFIFLGFLQNRRKAAVSNELKLLRGRIDEAGIDSTVQKLASLLKTSKVLCLSWKWFREIFLLFDFSSHLLVVNTVPPEAKVQVELALA